MALTAYRPAERIKFECEICANDYDSDFHRPMVLVPCGHTFCAACIERLDNEECPYDRKTFTAKMPNWEVERAISSKHVDESSRMHFLRRFILASLIRGYNQLSYEDQCKFKPKFEVCFHVRAFERSNSKNYWTLYDQNKVDLFILTHRI